MAKTSYNPQQRNRESYEKMLEEGGLVPPQAVELEEAILGALMLEKDSIIAVQEVLTADAFYKETHRTIYKAIEQLSIELNPVDLFTVTEKLKQDGKLKAVGGAAFLAGLTQKVGSAAHVEYHAKIIAQKYVQRELIRASTEIQKRSYDESTDVTDLIDYAESEIMNVSEGHMQRSVQASGDILRRTMEAIEEASKNEGEFNGVPSGFTGIDRVTLGWQPSDLIIVAARPSMGKTAFTLSMARNVAVDHQRAVAFFSLEMSATQLMMRLIVAESGLDSRAVKSGQLTPEQWRHLESSIKPFQNAPLYIDDTPALSVFEFRSKVRRLKKLNKIELIVIDYLQLMTGPQGSQGNREQEVASISRTLKAIAKELEVPIIALSQLNRAAELRGGSKKPQLSDLRESGAIEQDADIVAFIHRPEYFGMKVDEDNIPLPPGLAEFILAKHRNGATDTIRLKFRKEQAKFMDFDDDYDMAESSMNGDSEGGYSPPRRSNYDDDSPF